MSDQRRWLLEYGGVRIALRAKCTRSESFVLDALSAMPLQLQSAKHALRTKSAELGEFDADISLKHEAGNWVLTDHSTTFLPGLKQYEAKQYEAKVQRINHSGDALYHLTDRIVFHVANQSLSECCIHAAAVVQQSQALILPADSGAGKSSFTAWLVRQGFGYLTDELVMLGADGGLTGITRPIQIKPNGLSAIRPLLTSATSVTRGSVSVVNQRSLIYHGKVANGVPISALGGEIAEPGAKLGAFVFPRYSPQATFAWRPLSSAEAGMRLMASHVNARNLPGHGFNRMMACARQAPAYELEYGGFECLPSNFTKQLKGLLMAVNNC